MCRIMSPKRILSSLGKGPAQRNLFGPVDREQLQVEYQASLRQDLEEASRRWGFDFLSDKPLENSNYKWEGVPVAKVPLLYRSCMPDVEQPEVQSTPAATPVVTPRARRVSSTRSGKENIPCTPLKCVSLDLENMEKTPPRGENKGLKRKQTNITDFYQTKRRVVWMPCKAGE